MHQSNPFIGRFYKQLNRRFFSGCSADSTDEGWGTTAFLGSSSPSLREVEVPIWNNQACLEAIGKNVFNTTLCAGGRIKSADACQVSYCIR